MFKKNINEMKTAIIESISNLVSFPSISVETNDEKMPFGKACNDALIYFLDLANKLGFKTKNVDGYCGYAEFGTDSEMIGIVGHLDVVPANADDWSHSPFSATIENNRIYGRGTIDDKGPVIASLYAMKSVMDYYKNNNLKFNKRVRLIVGLNEETHWKCINYYKSHEEIPSLGFSPDSDFPCIYAEKSVLSLSISNKLLSNDLISIVDIDCNNNAINVVPKFCSVTLKLNSCIDLGSIKSIIDKYDYDIEMCELEEHIIKLSSYGVSAHSAHPDLGVNAISHLIIILNKIFEEYQIDFSLLDNFCKYIGNEYNGNNMELNIEDESGKLTLNASQLYIKDNMIFIGINLRIPINTEVNTVVNKFEQCFSNNIVTVLSKMDSLYVNKNDKLVKTLCDVFNSSCNSNFEPIAIGGATYARAFPNCVSFGMNFPGDKDMCHQVDEFIDIDKLLLSTNIYANAIFKLLNF